MINIAGAIASLGKQIKNQKSSTAVGGVAPHSHDSSKESNPMVEDKINFMGQKEYPNFKQMAGDTQPYADNFTKNFQKPEFNLGTQTEVMEGSIVDVNSVPTTPAPILDIPLAPEEIQSKIS